MKLRSALKYLALVAIAAGGSVFAMLTATRQLDYAEVLFALEIEQTANDLLREALLQDTPVLTPPVAGFGLYDQRGMALLRLGTAPAELAGPRPRRGTMAKPLIQTGPATFVFLRPASRPRQGMLPHAGGLAMASLYLQLHAPGHAGTLLMWRILFWVLPVAWTGLVIAAQRAFRYWLAMKDELESRREQVRYAEAGRLLAHEIRNPLATIRLQCELLEDPALYRESRIPPELGMVKAETSRIAQLIDRVRDFLHDPRGNPVPTPLWPALRDQVERSGPRVSLGAIVPEALHWQVLVDPWRFESLVGNLLANALECSPGPVTVSLEQVGPRTVEIRIDDSGPGFPAPLLAGQIKAFASTKTGGSGLGLPLAQAFTSAIGGSLILENRSEGGGRARVILKLETDHAHSDSRR